MLCGKRGAPFVSCHVRAGVLLEGTLFPFYASEGKTWPLSRVNASAFGSQSFFLWDSCSIVGCLARLPQHMLKPSFSLISPE